MTGMVALILGLLLFLGVHSVRIFAPDWRLARIDRFGEGPWKGGYSLLSAVGLALIVWGYGAARSAPVDLWLPPIWTRHLAVLLMWPAFVLLVTAYLPGTQMKAKLRHPMLLGVKLWAVAHLLANGRAADLLLFGAFLAWAVLDLRSARDRDRAAGTVYPPGRSARDALAVGIGTLVWAAFSFWAHAWLFGVAPLGRTL